MKKQIIKLTEQDLHSLIKESVNKIITELDSSTVTNAMGKMRRMGANDRADHLGQLAVANYGGKDLSDAGFTSREHGDRIGLGRNEDAYRRNRADSEANDRYYDEQMADYNKKNKLSRMFSKEPQKPVNYGKPEYVKSGQKFISAEPRTSNPKVARQAANFNKWARNGKTSSSNFRA